MATMSYGLQDMGYQRTKTSWYAIHIKTEPTPQQQRHPSEAKNEL